MKVIILDSVTSTSDYLLRFVGGGENVAVFAKKQTGGRGTKGRSFVSDEGGVYVSVLKYYPNLTADRAYSIVSETAVAVVKTLSAFGVKAQIKWPNDIFVDGKKICGILTENRLENGRVLYSIIGIGINVNNNLAKEIADIATSAYRVLGKRLDIESVYATLIYNLEHPDMTKGLYEKYSCVIGKNILVIYPDGSERSAIAQGILPDGRLKLADGEILSSAEIKINLE